jgi:hypothetical protein
VNQLIYQAGTLRPAVSKREDQNLELRQNWKKVSGYLRCAILAGIRHNRNCNGYEKKILAQRAASFCQVR